MLSHRLTLMRILVLLVALIFVVRLVDWQLGQGEDLRQASEMNHVRWVRAPAARGRILDRNGQPLATSILALTVWLISREVPHGGWAYLYQRLIALGIYPDFATASDALADCRKFPGYIPVRLVSGLSMKDPLVTRLEEELPFLPGVFIRVEPVRYYPGGALAAHVLGYESAINAQEYAERRDDGYRMDDRIGKTGVEREFEDELRGTDGGEQIEVDAFGRKLSESSKVPPQPGDDVTLTLDLKIQQAAESAMQGHRGAVVALDPATGDILALVSVPSFDLNGKGAHESEFNRALRGGYPPGSVFKIITTAAGLETDNIHADTVFTCTGEYHGIHCDDRAGHGTLGLTSALAYSCNVYFMHVAERVGAESLAKMARRFGLGQEADIDGIFTGLSGTVPDPQQDGLKDWQLGDTLQMGIGQSSVQITPLQAAGIVAAIANGGKRVHPHLVLRVGNEPKPGLPPEPIGLRPETLSLIDRGLRAVVSEGTAKTIDASLHIAGKTGTAQNHGGDDHAWFAGYAPADNPTIAVAVLVENGGHGGVVAAPIAETIIRAAEEETKAAGK